LRALPERNELAIGFPNLSGYRIEHPGERVQADFSGTPPFRLDLTQMPVRTDLGTAFSGDRQSIGAQIDSLRDQEVVYWIASQVLSRYHRADDGRPRMELFGDVRRIAQRWYDTKIDVIGDSDPRWRRLVRFEDAQRVAASVWLGVEAAAVNAHLQDEPDAPAIVPLLNRYNPRGHTGHVHASTIKPVFATTKSHVNYVVADTDSWEQIAAKTFEQLPEVEAYVKNAFLGFEVPYVDKTGTERRYQPDFLLRVKTPGDERFNLIVEISGFARDKVEKRWFVQQRWLPAVNGQRQQLGLLPWHFIEVTDIERIKEQLQASIAALAAEVDDAAERAAWQALQWQSLQRVWDNEHDEHWDHV
jgi:type III restriction enzyme